MHITEQTALNKTQAWQNECYVKAIENVRIFIRAPEETDMGIVYKEQFPIGLADSDAINQLAYRINILRHAKNVDMPFRIEVVDGLGRPNALDNYRTVGELRATYR